jgi:hypothetical protein
MDFLTTIENLLDMPPAEKAEVMRELAAHFDELRAEFATSGMDAVAAQARASQRLGTPSDIAARLNAAHNTASWRSALLCTVPFAASAVYSVVAALGAASGVRYAVAIGICVVALLASARELLRGRRPIWLATWLAMGLGCIPAVLSPLGGSTPLMSDQRAAAVTVLILCLIVLVLGLAIRRLLKAVVITCVLAALSAIGALLITSWVPVLVMMVSAVVLLVLVMRLVFELHPYGSGAQASLFLLAMLALGLSGPGRTPTWVQALDPALCGLAIVWFTRAPQRRTKMQACYVALFVHALAGGAFFTIMLDAHFPFSLLSAILSAAFSAWVCQLIVCWPLRSEESERNRLTIAR